MPITVFFLFFVLKKKSIEGILFSIKISYFFLSRSIFLIMFNFLQKFTEQKHVHITNNVHCVPRLVFSGEKQFAVLLMEKNLKYGVNRTCYYSEIKSFFS